ncbi:hypothetical protein CLU79DRAFT_866217 [Phycomyces nitens]|nr:hypothetical protein CLU79DRAFT_866217 [Phycomyces nitens]
MGFDARVYTLQLVNRGVYILQDHASFSFPTYYNSLKHDLLRMINGLSAIESLLSELKNMYETYQMNDDDYMSGILNGVTTKKKTSINCWTTEIIWNEKKFAHLSIIRIGLELALCLAGSMRNRCQAVIDAKSGHTRY